MGHYNIIIRVPSVPGFAECDVLVPMGGTHYLDDLLGLLQFFMGLPGTSESSCCLRPLIKVEHLSASFSGSGDSFPSECWMAITCSWLGTMQITNNIEIEFTNFDFAHCLLLATLVI